MSSDALSRSFPLRMRGHAVFLMNKMYTKTRMPALQVRYAHGIVFKKKIKYRMFSASFPPYEVLGSIATRTFTVRDTPCFPFFGG
ncbi:hypothetical protein CULC0102_1177 [Corynebacterium ulcerans 0102]|nr:hypothetical protein CULC0102_1177 [Corynebacterium ulcerans 0102]